MQSERIEPLDDSHRHDDCTAAHNCGEHPEWPFEPMTDEEWEPFAAATGIEPLNDSRQEFVEAMVRYVKTHERWSELSKEDAVRETLLVLTGDIGAAQGFLNAIGVKVDLYGDA